MIFAIFTVIILNIFLSIFAAVVYIRSDEPNIYKIPDEYNIRTYFNGDM